MSRAGLAASRVLQAAAGACRDGATTAMVSDAASEAIEREGAEKLFIGRVQGDSPPFAGAACVSVNEEVVHGVPGGRVLRPGDVVSVDVGLRLEGWCADTATTVLIAGEGVAEIELNRRRVLIESVRSCLDEALGMIRPGVRWSEIAMMMEREAVISGLGIVTEYVGHGVGRELHEAPRAPSFWSGFGGADFVLEEGLVLAVEPILTLRRGSAVRRGEEGFFRSPVRLLADGWTVVTADGGPAAHEERMVAVVPGGSRVLSGCV